MSSAKHEDFILFTNMNKLQINIICSAGYKTHRYIAPDKTPLCFLHHRVHIFYFVLPVLHICIVGSSFGWSHHLAFGFLRRSTGWTIGSCLCRRPVGRTIWRSHLLHVTSPPTSCLGCSALDSSPTNWSDCLSLHRQ